MRFFMYHKKHAPTGKEFDSEVDSETPESLAEKGWVDNPAKIGVNVWGPDNEPYVQAMKQKYDRGEVKALDDSSEKIEGLADREEASWGDYPIDTLHIRNENRTVYEVLRRIKGETFVMNPDFQRDFIWDVHKQSKFIESVLMRIPLPVFYLAEDDLGHVVVVDGLQRLTTFKNFVDGKFTIKLLGRDELNGKRFKDLTPKLQNRIEDCNLILYTIDSKVPERARLDIFERVNSGVPLTRQQMRNSLFMGVATRFLKKEAGTEIFLEATGGSLRTDTMRDREFVNRFCAFQLLTCREYKGDMDEFLARGLRTMNKMDPKSLTNLSQEFQKSLANNLYVFGKYAFRKHLSTSDRRSVLNASLWDVMSTGLSRYSESRVKSRAKSLRRAFYRLMQNDDFVMSITYGTNDPQRVNLRFVAANDMFQEVLGDHSD